MPKPVENDDKGLEIVLIDYSNYKEAARVLYSAFSNDLFSKYYFHHLCSLTQHVVQHTIETLRYNFLKQQLRYFLKNCHRFLIIGIKDQTTGALVNISAWKLPEQSYLLNKSRANLQRNVSFGKSIRSRLLNINTYLRMGSAGTRKFARIINYIKYTENDLLHIYDDGDPTMPLFYRLMIIGTAPEYQRQGYAREIIEYTLKYINNDYVSLLRSGRNRPNRDIEITNNGEGISNCRYDMSDILKPPVVIEASTAKNSEYYIKDFGCSRFATIYINDPDVDNMIHTFDKNEQQMYKDDIEDINGTLYFRIDVLLLNRVCGHPIKVVP